MIHRRANIAVILLVVIGTCGCFKKQPPNTQTTGKTKAAGSAKAGPDPLQSYHAKEAAKLDALIGLPVQSHWKPRRSPVFDVVYMGDPGDVYYVRWLSKETDHPAKMNDIETVRDFYREACIAETGGIIQVDVQKVKGRDAIVYYSKQVVTGIRGYRYVARCVLPVADGWQEVRMDAIQMGMTGAREAMTTMSLGKNIETEDVPENAAPTPGGRAAKGATRIKGFSFDPYKPEHHDRAMNSIADDVKYDEHTPTHPLSRIRRAFPKLLEEMTLPATAKE